MLLEWCQRTHYYALHWTSAYHYCKNDENEDSDDLIHVYTDIQSIFAPAYEMTKLSCVGVLSQASVPVSFTSPLLSVPSEKLRTLSPLELPRKPDLFRLVVLFLIPLPLSTQSNFRLPTTNVGNLLYLTICNSNMVFVAVWSTLKPHTTLVSVNWNNTTFTKCVLRLF